MNWYQWIIIVLFLPLFMKAQTGFGVKKIVNNKLCDTCIVRNIFDGEEPVSFLIAGAREEGEYHIKNAQKSSDSTSTIFKYSIAAGSFSLDFIPYLPVELWSANPALQKKYTQELSLQNYNTRFCIIID